MKAYMILLAAGESRRFKEGQGNKLLCPFHGKPMYQHLADAVDGLPKGLLAGKAAVTRHPPIMDELGRRDYQIIENHDSALGISHSIHLGLGALGWMGEGPSAAEACCFAVCDQPYLTALTLGGFIEGWMDSGKGLGCLGFHGELGNPAIFSRPYQQELLALRGDKGGKSILRRHPEDVYVYEVEDVWELTDMDERILERV